MLVIYSKEQHPRLTFTLDHVFRRILRLEYSLVHDINLIANKETVINYSLESIPYAITINPNGFIFSSGIHPVVPAIDSSGPIVKLFADQSEYGFDVFSAIFYMLSRHEEYLPFSEDAHGRFPASASISGKNNFVAVPVVDYWIQELVMKIKTKFKLNFDCIRPEVFNTIDVDNAFAHYGKSWWRKTGANFRDLLKGNSAQRNARKMAHNDLTKDEYNTYAYIKSVSDKFNVRTIFFHLSGKLAHHDRNLNIESTAYKNLLQDLKSWSTTGIHPSYSSNSNPELVVEELKALSKSSGEQIKYSRQHFLKLRFPDHYRKLISLGITDDFTMGFADSVGFRAGTANPFYFYDLKNESATSLTIHPFCVMDGTLRDYMKLSPDGAINIIHQLQNHLKASGGSYIAIWHNETLGETNGWNGWRKVYEFQFENLKKLGYE